MATSNEIASETLDNPLNPLPQDQAVQSSSPVSQSDQNPTITGANPSTAHVTELINDETMTTTETSETHELIHDLTLNDNNVNNKQWVSLLNSLFAEDESKAYFEKISLIWAPISMTILLVLILGTPIYKKCDRNAFLAISLILCLPAILIPLLKPCDADQYRPIHKRFWFKANIWIITFGFYGNYFWTHYFYEILGAEYLFDSYQFNNVPVVTYICTFFYFTFYFSFINIVLRFISSSISDFPNFGKNVIWCFAISVLSYSTAVFEAVSIQHFPLYTYKQKDLFFIIGSVVYGLYFIVGFPMFFELDEFDSNQDTGQDSRRKCTIKDIIYNVFAACAIVTLLLDLWRLCIGSIYDIGSSKSNYVDVPFIYQSKNNVCNTIAQSVAPSIPPMPSTEYVYVQRPITAEACMKQFQGWAWNQVTNIQDLINLPRQR